jgi:hypothetical protein
MTAYGLPGRYVTKGLKPSTQPAITPSAMTDTIAPASRRLRTSVGAAGGGNTFVPHYFVQPRGLKPLVIRFLKRGPEGEGER